MSKRKLANNRDIMRFALVWEQMYRSHRTIPGVFFEEPLFVADGLASLGFEMDCGEAFSKKFCNFPLPGQNLKEWQKMLDKIDIQTLGNTIFSQWRYFNHWNPTPMNETDFQWFVMSFAHLAKLAEMGISDNYREYQP